ncbi:hypothetical protein T492DRAFT_175407 [Pavlovales sp. CCMP2436]|nr:hypothetical protein T492DRAFT_175407 [Pavlovales sp. CCMP2436]
MIRRLALSPEGSGDRAPVPSSLPDGSASAHCPLLTGRPRARTQRLLPICKRAPHTQLTYTQYAGAVTCTELAACWTMPAAAAEPPASGKPARVAGACPTCRESGLCTLSKGGHASAACPLLDSSARDQSLRAGAEKKAARAIAKVAAVPSSALAGDEPPVLSNQQILAHVRLLRAQRLGGKGRRAGEHERAAGDRHLRRL